MRDDDIPTPVVVPWPSFRHIFLRLAALIVVLIAIVAWQSRWPRYEISSKDISEASTREIRCFKGNAHALEIHVSGEINGHALFVTPYGQFELEPGQISLETGAEYYEESARWEYLPGDVTEGHLVVQYKFHIVY